MPLTPADTETTLSGEIIERARDKLDILTQCGRKRPFATIAAAVVLGLLTARFLC